MHVKSKSGINQMGLAEYKRKRNFRTTPEPPASMNTKLLKKNKKPDALHFVIQKHDATRLHYDFRLETRNGVLKSWAVPKGVSLHPSVKRLAVMTEDHPGDYIDFEGQIPYGNYGAGRVIVWDIGRYESNKDVEDQVREGKVKFTLFGEKVKGSFSLFKMKKKDDDNNQWLLTKSHDEYASVDDLTNTLPQSAITGSTIESMTDPRAEHNSTTQNRKKGLPGVFPTNVKPMLALPVDEPFDSNEWVFEVKWDGVRAILFQNKSDSILEIRSRKGGNITQRYPEIIRVIDSNARCTNSVVLDGEIVILNKKGIPDFQKHQRRMNVDDKKEIEFLSHDLPATYYVFDILYLDGLNLEHLDYMARRQILCNVIRPNSSKIRISDYFEGNGRELFEQTIKMKLEGIVAKHKSSIYIQGIRSSDWLKIKSVITQDCIVIGYTKGEGNREGYFGSLILAVNDNNDNLRFVGHTGSGFDFSQLADMLKIMQKLATDNCPIEYIPYVNREPIWLRPELVVEVKFNGWTQEMIMRAPIFVRLREDKKPQDCTFEMPKETKIIVKKIEQAQGRQEKEKVPEHQKKQQQSFSNLDKAFFPATSKHNALTKQDLIDYYDAINSFILPHLRNRPLSLSRYPDGILGKSFYHKNWEQNKPDYVKTIQVYSESSNRIINYLICNNRESLLWLANMGCIEMHPWFSRVHDLSACAEVANITKSEQVILNEGRCGLETPDFVVFDLDPYIYSGKEKKGNEPEYNREGFRAAVEVAYDLQDLLESLRIRSYVKTSGKTGLHVFVPVAPLYTYDQTREFARLVGIILSRKSRNKITMEWDITKRKGKVFFDYNQNAKGKTISSILSVRPTLSATVSMPVEWKYLDSILPTDFAMQDVPNLLKKSGDTWKDILSVHQDLAHLLDDASEITF